MAMDLIYGLDPQELKAPKYIKEGLEWLESAIVGTTKVEDEQKVAGGQDAA